MPHHHLSSLYLIQLTRGHGYSITLSFFEPLIKDKRLVLAWHLKLRGGFDDLVAGCLAVGLEVSREAGISEPD